MHSFLHSQHPPSSPTPYNAVHHNHYQHGHSMNHTHHPSLSMQSFASPPTLQQLTQQVQGARQGQSSPAPLSVGPNAPLIPNAHWAQQLLKAELCRAASPAHHRARQSALATRNSTKSAIPITNPNLAQTAVKENGHVREMSVSSLATESSNAIETSVASTDAEHPSSLNAPAPRPTATRNTNDSWNTLDMGGMQLKKVGKGLFNFTFLTILYLNHNQLVTLPPEISRLRNLIHLDLSGNLLSTVPPALGMLASLRELLLFDNRLKSLPTELGNLHQLDMLGIEGNQLEPKYYAIAQKDGTRGLINWLRDQTPSTPEPPPRTFVPVISEQERKIQLADPDVVDFSVSCYNILWDKCATSTMYGYTPSWALAWNHRKERILKDLLEVGSDIICLQEVDQAQYEDFFCPALRKEGWDGAYSPRGRAKTMPESKKREVDGCATFFRSSKFALVETQVIEFHSIIMQSQDFIKSDDMFNRVLQRDNIALVLTLEERETGTRLIVSNTHIYWDIEHRDVKLVQVGILMQELQKIADQFAKLPPRQTPDGKMLVSYPDSTKIPIIVAGDYNSVQDSGVYKFLNDGFVPGDHPDFLGRTYGKFTSEGLLHKFNLKSAYGSIGELPFTNLTPSFQGVLDYIWYSTYTSTVTDVLGDIDEEYLNRVVGFPSAHFPSDHIHLSAKFIIKPPKESTTKTGPPGLRHPAYGL